jgi:hypothetical protein
LPLVWAVALTACGGLDAEALAKRACRTFDQYTGVIPPGDKDPELADMTTDADAAAEKDARYAALSAAVTAWSRTARRQQTLTRNGFKSMTASENAELDALNKVSQGQYDLVAVECRKARGGQ